MGAQGCQQAPRPAPEPPISPAGVHGVAGGAGFGWGGAPSSHRAALPRVAFVRAAIML